MFHRIILSFSLFFAFAIFVFANESVFESVAKPTLVENAKAGEGPAWHPDFGLFFSGRNGIDLLTTDGEVKAFRPDAGTNGLLFDQRGRLIACEPGRRRVTRMDMKTREIEVLTDQLDGKKYNQPNDVAVDSKGRIYFSDPKYGPRTDMEMLDEHGRKIEGVYRIDLDKKVTRIIVHEVDRPNGLVVSSDDQYLFVADNNNNEVGAARNLWRFNLDANGDLDLSSKKLMFDWKTGRGPDGMALDELGRLYVAGGLNQPNPPFETASEFKGGVYVFSPDGELLDFAAVPNDEVTNCTFGGDDLKTLYITAGGTLWKIRTKSQGQKMMKDG